MPAFPVPGPYIAGPYQSSDIPVSCSDLTALAGIPVSQIGAPIFVASRGEIWWSCFQLPSGMSTSADGSTGAVAAPNGGAYVSSGAVNSVSPTIFQPNWFISNAGNTTNSGATSGSPITEAERQRRWGTGVAQLAAPTTVTYLDSPSDVVNYNVQYGTGAGLTILGTLSLTNPNVALTAVTALNRAAQTPWDVTGVGLGAADVTRLMRINAGPRAGNYCGVAKDLGAGRVRVSPFGVADFGLIASTGICFTQATPQIGDVVDVFTVPTLTFGTLIFRTLTNVALTQTTNCVVLDSVKLDGGAVGPSSLLGTILLQGAQVVLRQAQIQRCKIGGYGGFWMGGGEITGNFQVQAAFSNNGGPFAQLLGFLMTGASAFTVQSGGSATIGSDCLFQNASCQSAGNLVGEFVSVFDRAAANLAVQVFTGGYYRSRALLTTDLLWGDGNAGTGVKVLSGGAITYVTKPTINTPQGAGRQSLIGGTNTDWVGVPVVNAANNAMIVVEA